jgi:DNA-binding transcriptional regulator YdaS (Cro superfamily)
MHLREYLAQPDSMTVMHLRTRMNELGAKVVHDAQIRQWIAVDKKTGAYKRFPSPQNAYFLELATEGAVTRRDMRPKDYNDIWPNEDWDGIERRVGEPERRVGKRERRVGPKDRRRKPPTGKGR